MMSAGLQGSQVRHHLDHGEGGEQNEVDGSLLPLYMQGHLVGGDVRAEEVGSGVLGRNRDGKAWKG